MTVAGRLAEVRTRARRRLQARPLRRGHEVLEIRKLISPLRYDVVVRWQFFTQLEAYRDEPPAVVLEVARREPYFVWFKSVECARFFPRLLADPALLSKRFEDRVTRALATLRSFDTRGFDAQHPVTLVATSGPQTADSGAVVSQRLHIADGCHRLALLLRLGQDLEPPMYQVRNTRGPILDNTAILLRRLDLADEDYAQFLSHRYASEVHSDLAELRTAVARRSPDDLAELDQVLASHRRTAR